MLQRAVMRFLRASRPDLRANPAQFRTGHHRLDMLIYGSRREVFAAWLWHVLTAGGAPGEWLADALGRPFGRYTAGDGDNNVTADNWLEAAGEAGWISVGGPSRPTLSQRAWHGLSYGGDDPPPRPSYFFWEPGPARAQAMAFVQSIEPQPDIRYQPPRPPMRRDGFPYAAQPLIHAPMHFGVIDRRTGDFLPGEFDDPDQAHEYARRLNRTSVLLGVEGAEDVD